MDTDVVVIPATTTVPIPVTIVPESIIVDIPTICPTPIPVVVIPVINVVLIPTFPVVVAIPTKLPVKVSIILKLFSGLLRVVGVWKTPFMNKIPFPPGTS